MKTKGFSLFEVVVYLGIFSLIITALLALAAQSSQSGAKALAEQEVLHHSTFIVERLRADMHAATTIDATALSSNELMLTRADGTIVRYVVSGNSLTRQVDAASAITLTNDDVVITDFTLTNVTPFGSSVHDVDISFTVTTNTASVRPEFQAEQLVNTTFSLRP